MGSLSPSAIESKSHFSPYTPKTTHKKLYRVTNVKKLQRHGFCQLVAETVLLSPFCVGSCNFHFCTLHLAVFFVQVKNSRLGTTNSHLVFLFVLSHQILAVSKGIHNFPCVMLIRVPCPLDKALKLCLL